MLVDWAGQAWTGTRQRGWPDRAPQKPPWREGLEGHWLAPRGAAQGSALLLWGPTMPPSSHLGLEKCMHG